MNLPQMLTCLNSLKSVLDQHKQTLISSPKTPKKCVPLDEAHFLSTQSKAKSPKGWEDNLRQQPQCFVCANSLGIGDEEEFCHRRRNSTLKRRRHRSKELKAKEGIWRNFLRWGSEWNWIHSQQWGGWLAATQMATHQILPPLECLVDHLMEKGNGNIGWSVILGKLENATMKDN